MTSRDDLRGRADALFDRALDLQPREQAAFLAAACSAEPELLAVVEDLLRLAGDPAGALAPEALKESPLWRELAVDLEARAPEVPAAQVGRWRLLGELGRGGMGVVYLAERADGEFEQRAALKLMHAGLASGEALRRVEQERQILAGLEHPGIARLLDGGRTEDGRPFLVMERVEGRPIDRYCDEERLTVAARLRLFVAVGRAVEHAHRSLVVHRDIKPSNIVVTDGGEVKLLDFGIAKLLQPEAVEVPLTRTVTRVLTPDYASPEQVLGGAITVASDVYQLGLLLYELLTGRRPYRVAGVSALDIERTICHQEPRRPSAAVEVAPPAEPEARTAEEIAALRRTTPRALARRLRGDLDTIVLQALRKEPERRYPSVAHLVEDVERHLAALPVVARGDSVGYRAARFASRHRAALAAALLGVLLLAGWALSATRQAVALGRERDRARAEAAKARQVKELVTRLFESADPEEARGRELTVREVLDRGWASVEDELAGQPEVQVELLETVGRVYRELGVYDRARPFLDRALELARGMEGVDPGLLTSALHSHGRLLRDLGEYDAAEADLRAALELRRARLGAVHPDVARVLSDLAMTAHNRGAYAQGEELFRQALAMRRELYGDAHPEVAEALDELGMSLRQRGRYAEAEPLLRQALQLRRGLLPEKHPQLAAGLSNLALLVQNLGRLDEAEALLREALEMVIAVRGEEHLYTAVTMNNLARLLRARGDLDAAEPLLSRALAIRRRTLGASHPQVAMNLNDLGRLLDDRGDLDGAEALYREALAAYAPDHPWRSATVFNLGRLREARQDWAGAERLYREALAEQRRHYGPDHERVGVDLNRLGVVLHRQGDLAGAEAALREALEIFRQRLPENHARLAEALVPLGEALTDGGRPAEAEPLLREGLAILEAGFGGRDPRTVAAAAALQKTLATRR